MNYEQNHLRNFFTNRPALNLSELDRICQLPLGTLRHFMKERRELPVHHIEVVNRELYKYGFVALGDDNLISGV
jgi:predicted transcriptional regulator